MIEFGQRLRVAPDMARCYRNTHSPTHSLSLTRYLPRALMKTMQKDSELLAQLGIIDYSLLLGDD